jgi:hypothetical protein
VETASESLRHKKLNTGKLRLEITFADGKRATGQVALQPPAFLAQTLYSLARELLHRLTQRRVRVRTLLLARARLSPQVRQRDLFSPDTAARAARGEAASGHGKPAAALWRKGSGIFARELKRTGMNGKESDDGCYSARL